MTKHFKILLLFLSLLLLGSCSEGRGNSSKAPSLSKENTARIIVKEEGNVIDKKVTFKEGDTVMDILKDNYDIQESGGFITTIDGIQQDKKSGKYWMFDVNGKLAPKVANQIKVKDGDKIEFYQEIYKG